MGILEEKIESINYLFPYVGTYEISGKDPKGRVSFSYGIRRIFEDRKKVLKGKWEILVGNSDFIYGNKEKNGNFFYLSVWDYIPIGKKSEDFYRMPIEIKKYHRISVPKKISLSSERCVAIGKKDHFEIWAKGDWEKHQGVSSQM